MEVLIGGGGAFVEDDDVCEMRMMMVSFLASLFKLWRLKEEEEDEIQR